MKKGVPKPITMSKLYEIRQEEAEQPGSFNKRIVVAFCQYRDLKHEARENQRMIAGIAIGVSWPNIRANLQKNLDSLVLPLAQLQE